MTATGHDLIDDMMRKSNLKYWSHQDLIKFINKEIKYGKDHDNIYLSGNFSVQELHALVILMYNEIGAFRG